MSRNTKPNTIQDINASLETLALATSNDSRSMEELIEANAMLSDTNKKLVEELEQYRNKNKIVRPIFNTNGYFWTHGNKVGVKYNYKTCNSRA